MEKGICAVLMIVAISLGGMASQTDWSEGPGMPGPVFDWESFFSTSSDISWDSVTGELLLAPEHNEINIFEQTNSYVYAYPGDIDNDGDVDAAGFTMYHRDIFWWENASGCGDYWIQHFVTTHPQVNALCVGDIDGDSDFDIVFSAGWASHTLYWLENSDGNGLEWIDHIISDSAFSISCIRLFDIDNDGNRDVIASADYSDESLVLWKNTDGSGTNWERVCIDDGYIKLKSIYIEDIDNDNNYDIVGTTQSATDEVYWWENLTGTGDSWNRHLIGDFQQGWSITCCDIDGDGDVDAVTSGGYPGSGDEVAWWENLDGYGGNWEKRIISHDVWFPISVSVADFDNDDDQDVLCAELYGVISYWENIDGTGESWTEHQVDDKKATLALPADFNNDGSMDVLGCSYNNIGLSSSWASWYSLNELKDGRLISSILDMQCDASWGHIEWSCSEPPQTSVALQVRSTDTSIFLEEWSDTLYSPCSLTEILDAGDTFFQYRVLLNTDSSDVSPHMYDISVSWDEQGLLDESLSHALHPFSPNPTSQPKITFFLSVPGSVEFQIYDIAGRRIDKSVAEFFPQGIHELNLSIQKSGVYFCRMLTNEYIGVQRFAVLR